MNSAVASEERRLTSSRSIEFVSDVQAIAETRQSFSLET